MGKLYKLHTKYNPDPRSRAIAKGRQRTLRSFVDVLALTFPKEYIESSIGGKVDDNFIHSWALQERDRLLKDKICLVSSRIDIVE